MKHVWWYVRMLTIGGLGAGVMAQGPLPEQPSEGATKTERTKEPTLDELLGLPTTNDRDLPRIGEGDAATSKPEHAGKTSDANTAALDRLLTTEEVEEEFAQAVQLMGEASTRLNAGKDYGIETQRMQESILRKLDKLLDDAQKRQQQKQQKSSSSKSQQQPQPQKQNQQPKQQQSAAQKNQSAQGPQANQGGPPGRRDGAGSAVNAGGGAEWGNLPERLRDSLMQGQGDSYSSTYRSKTEEYYRRLAEEPKPTTPK